MAPLLSRIALLAAFLPATMAAVITTDTSKEPHSLNWSLNKQDGELISLTANDIEKAGFDAKALSVRCVSCTGEGKVTETYTAPEMTIEFQGDEGYLDLNLKIKSSGAVDHVALPLTANQPDVEGEGIHIDLVIQTTEAVDVAGGIRVELPKGLKLGFDVTKGSYLKDKYTTLGAAPAGGRKGGSDAVLPVLQVHPLELTSGRGKLTLGLRLRAERDVAGSRVGAFLSLAQYNVVLGGNDSQDPDIFMAAGAYSDGPGTTSAGIPKSEAPIFTAARPDTVPLSKPTPPLPQHTDAPVLNVPLINKGPLGPIGTNDNRQQVSFDRRTVQQPKTVTEPYVITVCPTTALTGIDCPTPHQTTTTLTRTVTETYTKPAEGEMTVQAASSLRKRTIAMPNLDDAAGTLPKVPDEGISLTIEDTSVDAAPDAGTAPDLISESTTTASPTGDLGGLKFDTAKGDTADSMPTTDSELSLDLGLDDDLTVTDGPVTFTPITTSDSTAKYDDGELTPEPTPCTDCGEDSPGGVWHWHPSGDDGDDDDHSGSYGDSYDHDHDSSSYDGWGWGGYGKGHHFPGYPHGGPKWPGFGGHHGHDYPGWGDGHGHHKFPGWPSWGQDHDGHGEDCDCEDKIPPPPPPKESPCDPDEQLYLPDPESTTSTSADFSILPVATETSLSDLPDSIIDKSGSSSSSSGDIAGLGSAPGSSSESANSTSTTDTTATTGPATTSPPESSPSSNGDADFNILDGLSTDASPSNEGKSDESDADKDRDKGKNNSDSPMEPSWPDSKPGDKEDKKEDDKKEDDKKEDDKKEDDKKDEKDKPTTLATVSASVKPTTTPNSNTGGTPSGGAEAQTSSGIPKIFADGKSDSAKTVAGSGAALVALAIGAFALL